MNRLLAAILLLLWTTTVGISSCQDSPPAQAKKAVAEIKKEDAEPEPPVIGRITFMEKNVFRYLRDAQDWALAMVDVPVGDGDVLYSDSQGRSELTFPNDTKVRLNDKTKVQLDGLKGNSTALFVNSGIARIQNRGADTLVKVDTPYGQVFSKQPGDFDVYVGDSSVAVTAFNKPIQFVDGKGTAYDIKPDADSLLANEKAVVSTPRYLNSRWDSWNNERDKELQVWEVNPSPYLPAQLKSESRTLADNGNWEQITYNGETAQYWTPRNVALDWSPFTVGQWTYWNGEQLWVPYERFGWVTHHHGGWIHHNGRWYWRPPAAGRWRYVPWYPARVAWVHTGRHIGWVPISPYEVYYGRRYWGPRSVVYNDRIRNIEIRRYVNVNRVVVVEKERLYGVHRRYEGTRNATLVKEVVNNGRGAPLVTREVVKGADTRMEQHFARSGDFSRKPNAQVINEFAARRRGSGTTATAQTATPEVRKAALKTSPDKVAASPPAARAAAESKRTMPETPKDLRREQHQERRLEANTGRSLKEAPRQPMQQQKQQQAAERQQQQAQQRRQQQFERQQQQQLMQEQQRAQRQQQQLQRQQQVQAQQQQRQLAQQQQQAQREQQQIQRQQQQQAKPGQNQRQGNRHPQQ